MTSHDIGIDISAGTGADWHRRVVGRSLQTAAERSVDRGRALIRAAATVLERSKGDDITVQDVADEAGQSLRTLYQYFESKDDLLLAVFEEAMRTYAQLISAAIDDLDDPLDRLAGALLAALTMPAFSDTGFDRGLARLRLRLAEVAPEALGRAQIGVTRLLRELLDAAAATARIDVDDDEAATFLVLALNAAFITSERLGNDTGVRRPDAYAVVRFALKGLGASPEPGWLEGIQARLRLPARRPRLAAAPASGPNRKGRAGAPKANR